MDLGGFGAIDTIGHVRQAFKKDPELCHEEIVILCYRGRLHLTGVTKNTYLAQKAPLVASCQPGVKEVMSSIAVN